MDSIPRLPWPAKGLSTVTAGNITIVNPLNPSGPALATGTITGTTTIGVWDNGAGDTGFWTGAACP